MPTIAAIADWGTTHFRVWGLGANGLPEGEASNSAGMAVLKPGEFEQVLEDALQKLGTPADAPVLICGMAGSRQGWQEASYLPVGAALEQLASNAVRVATAGRDVRILPGFAQSAAGREDVMRGEETALLGAATTHHSSGVFCIPGTHSKWVWLEDGKLASFRTAMTGELFHLLATNSTLSHFCESSAGKLHESTGFSDAVEMALSQPAAITSQLFSVRARPLLAATAKLENMAPRLSGLLIGGEIAAMLPDAGTGITLIATGELASVYQMALRIAQIPFATLDSQKMVQAGLGFAASQIWKGRINSSPAPGAIG